VAEGGFLTVNSLGFLIDGGAGFVGGEVIAPG
jgi:hypothetical protein